MTIAILDYANARLEVIYIPDETKNIEQYLFKTLGYREADIYWMEVDEVNIEIYNLIKRK
jgi:hypothetical protein